jgi:hypothetical protein
MLYHYNRAYCYHCHCCGRFWGVCGEGLIFWVFDILWNLFWGVFGDYLRFLLLWIFFIK